MRADKVDQLVPRTIEDTIAQNSTIHPPDPGDFGIKSVSLPGVSIVTVQLAESVIDTKKEFNDINLRLKSITSLPSGAGPIQFLNDFGNTAALMLTVASPKVSGTEVALRARAIAQAITDVRLSVAPGPPGSRATIVAVYPASISPQLPQHTRDLLARYMAERRFAHDPHPLQGAGFVGLDIGVEADDATILDVVHAFIREQLGTS